MISEWLNELDEVSFEAEGLPCRMARGSSGAWCGYVGIPSTHPWFGKHYDDKVPLPKGFAERKFNDGVGVIDLFLHALDKDQDTVRISLALEVHGGITWAGDLPWSEPSKYHWFGFDCAHAGDYTLRYGLAGDIYRNQSYVVSECQHLAKQLSEVV